MIKVLLIDDEPLASSLIVEYLASHSDKFEVVGICTDGFKGVKAIGELQPDLLFLDVQMPKINGFEMLELVESPPPVIFTTAFDQFAIQAFEASAIDYLLKPFSKERFDKAILKFLHSSPDRKESTNFDASVFQEKEQNRIVLKEGGKIMIIPIQDIFHLEADDDYVQIHTREGKFIKKKTLQYYEDSLSSSFFVRVHRSHLINISHLNRIDPYEKNSHIAILTNNSRVPISRSGYQNLKQALKL
jgi:two-component system LytT family response regulator